MHTYFPKVTHTKRFRLRLILVFKIMGDGKWISGSLRQQALWTRLRIP